MKYYKLSIDNKKMILKCNDDEVSGFAGLKLEEDGTWENISAGVGQMTLMAASMGPFISKPVSITEEEAIAEIKKHNKNIV